MTHEHDQYQQLSTIVNIVKGTLMLKSTKKVKIVEFANSIDPDEVAHNEPLHLDLHYLPARL